MSVLDDAFDLIEKGQLADARSLLTANEADFASNPDYWWLVAHASDNPVQGRNALNQVLVLDKNYPGAKELDSQVRAAELIQNVNEPRQQRRWFPILLVVLLLIAVGIILFLIANAAGGGGVATEVAVVTDAPTQPIGVVVPTITDITIVPTLDSGQATIVFENTPTLDVTDEVSATSDLLVATLESPTTEILPTDITSQTEEPTLAATATEDTGLIAPTLEAQAVPVIYAFMQGQNTPENGVVLEGSTLKIQLCAIPGIEAGNAIRDLLLTISTGTNELDATIAIIEIALVDCINANEEQRVVAIDRTFVDSFANGGINLQQLQQEIRPVR